MTSCSSTDFARKPRIDVTLVRVGDASERIYESGVAEAGYEPDPAAAATLATAATLTRGRVLEEGQVGEVAAAVRERARARARRSTGASRGTARHSCRTSRCWRSSRSDSSSTVAISESG